LKLDQIRFTLLYDQDHVKHFGFKNAGHCMWLYNTLLSKAGRFEIKALVYFKQQSNWAS